MYATFDLSVSIIYQIHQIGCRASTDVLFSYYGVIFEAMEDVSIFWGFWFPSMLDLSADGLEQVGLPSIIDQKSLHVPVPAVRRCKLLSGASKVSVITALFSLYVAFLGASLRFPPRLWLVCWYISLFLQPVNEVSRWFLCLSAQWDNKGCASKKLGVNRQCSYGGVYKSQHGQG